MNETAIAPTLEERYAAAAFNILTDDNRHSLAATFWARLQLERAAKGRSTAFQRRMRAQTNLREIARSAEIREQRA